MYASITQWKRSIIEVGEGVVVSGGRDFLEDVNPNLSQVGIAVGSSQLGRFLPFRVGSGGGEIHRLNYSWSRTMEGLGCRYPPPH